MKKCLKLFTLAFALLFATIISVKADVKEVDNETDLSTALQNGESVKLTDNIDNISNIIKVKGKGTIVIDGNGKTVSAATPKKVFEIYAEDGELEVIFENITIINSYSGSNSEGGRAIDTRTADITLTVKKSTLKTTSSANNQPLTIGGSAGPVVVNLNETTIEAGVAGYGIISFVPANITIDKSNIGGYAAIYMKEGTEGSEIVAKNGTVLTGENNHTGDSNNFGTIALEDDGIKIIVEDSTVEATGTGGAKQVIFSQADQLTVEKENTITVTGNSEILARPEGFFINQDTSKVVVETGVKTNIEVPEEYLPEGVKVEKDKDGNFIVVELVKEPNPNTGDNVVTYILIGLMSLVAFGYASNKLRKNA